MIPHGTVQDLVLTSELVRSFWQDMMTRFETRTCPKSRAMEMRATGRVLQWLRVMDRVTFMERYTTVWGRCIYPWFTIGEGNEEMLWSQIVVCVHEHQHVVQFKRDGFLSYSARYVLSSRRRALLEAEAYVCNIELHFLRHGLIPNLAQLAMRLGEYGCSTRDVAAALAIYESAAAEITQGRVLTEATRVALELLTHR